MTQFFILLWVLLLLSFSSYLLLTLLLDSLLSSNFLLRHSGTSLSTVQCLSRPPPLLLMPSILSASSSLSFLRFLLCVGDSSSGFMWFFLHSSWFPCAEIFLWLLVVSPSSRLLIPFSRLLTVVAMSFLSAIFASFRQLRLQHLGTYWTWEIHLDMSLPQSAPWLKRVWQSNLGRSGREGHRVSDECNMWHIPFFCCIIFPSPPLISLFWFSFPSIEDPARWSDAACLCVFMTGHVLSIITHAVHPACPLAVSGYSKRFDQQSHSAGRPLPVTSRFGPNWVPRQARLTFSAVFINCFSPCSNQETLLLTCTARGRILDSVLGGTKDSTSQPREESAHPLSLQIVSDWSRAERIRNKTRGMQSRSSRPGAVQISLGDFRHSHAPELRVSELTFHGGMEPWSRLFLSRSDIMCLAVHVFLIQLPAIHNRTVRVWCRIHKPEFQNRVQLTEAAHLFLHTTSRQHSLVVDTATRQLAIKLGHAHGTKEAVDWRWQFALSSTMLLH